MSVSLYFGYGSNLVHAYLNKRLEKRGGTGTALVTIACCVNYRLEFNYRYRKRSKAAGRAANIVWSPGERVWGGLYSISDENLALLDASEGVSWRGGYKRLPLIVFDKSGTEYTAWTYIASPRAKSGSPFRKYLDMLIKGAKELDLPLRYQEYLRNINAVDG